MMQPLANRTWRDLRAVARMYGLYFNNVWTHAEALASLRQRLLEDERYLVKALKRLSAEERQALMALKAHGGRLSRYLFTRTYGMIRLYRPWRVDAPHHPWRRPVSIAEKLWFLGMIEVQSHQAVLLPEAVAELLPDVPHPKAVIWQGDATELNAVAVVRDVAALLGTLLHSPVRLLHGRWLPPYAVKAINQRLSQPEVLTGVRSEFQTRRLRFLHYVAQVAGLISIQGHYLLPTVEAWQWLEQPYKEAHTRLLQAIRADLRARQPLWTQFKMPLIRAEIWEALLALIPGSYTLGSVSEAVQLSTLDPYATTQIRAALLQPLRWLGLGTLDGAQMTLQEPTFPVPTSAVLQVCVDSIGLLLPSTPPLRPLVELLGWAQVDARGLRVDAECLAHATEKGLTLEAVKLSISSLTGMPLPVDVVEKLTAWYRAVQQVHIRRVTVLEVAHTDQMQAIRADWRLRPLLGSQLSPHHIIVHDEMKLRQRLIRRAYRLTPMRDRYADALPRANNEDPAYLWLAHYICRQLIGLIPAPVQFPAAAAYSLEVQLSPRLGALQGIADNYVTRIRHALRPRTEVTSEHSQQEPQFIQNAVQQAQVAKSPVLIRYYSPYTDEVTERVIEPQTIYSRRGATYIEAWCQLEAAARTFRMDRILDVADNLPVPALA